MTKLKHDTSAAIAFLQRWLPEGPWALTAIVPDGNTDTVTYGPHNLEAMRAWIEASQGVKNFYFHVNPPMRAITSKAKKEDIASLAWLHVDIDPRVGEDMDSERERALRLLNNFSPAPTVIVDSGGGYQGFWRLAPDEALTVNGDLDKAAELEAYNMQLEKLFQADRCHNIDRIMRLPGTVNVPNAAKRKKGRKPALSKLVSWNDNVYPLALFTPAVRVQQREPGLTGGQPRVKISGNVERLGSADELREKWNVGDHAIALIVQGEDPVDPTRYPSRSELLFRVCCDLVRAKVPDEIVFSVITDPGFAISKSVTDKPNWEKYALRQIERAHEEAVDPWLRKLNEKHAVISDLGGKCRIISEVYDEALKRPRISRQSFDDFRNRYRNIRVKVGEDKEGRDVTKPAGNWWVDHPQRRQYETMIFAPGREVSDSYNLWKGFACDALPGHKHEGYLRHVKENICGGDEEHFQYLVQWMARAVQQPATAGETAVVLRGKRGTGKSFFVKTFGGLFGRHFLQVSNSQHLVGNFNAHLRDAVVLFGDEAFYAGDKKHESVLKTLVTEEMLMIEGKGVDVEAAPNYTHILLASNGEWVVPAGLDERRFFVLDVLDRHAKDLAYFRALKAEIDGGGRENLLHYLMHLPLEEFEVRRAPQTDALQDQKLLSMSPEELWLHEKLQEGRLLQHHEGWTARVAKDDLYDDYIADLRDQGRNFRLSRTAFGKFLARCFPGEYPVSKQELTDVRKVLPNGFETQVRRRVYFYHLPPLPTCREHWDRDFGGPHRWPAVPDDQGDLVEDDAPPF